MPVRVPEGKVASWDLMLRERDQVPWRARKVARAMNFPFCESWNIRSMIDNEVLASWREVEEAEEGRYRGGRTIPLRPDEFSGSVRLISRISARDSIR